MLLELHPQVTRVAKVSVLSHLFFLADELLHVVDSCHQLQECFVILDLLVADVELVVEDVPVFDDCFSAMLTVLIPVMEAQRGKKSKTFSSNNFL